MNCKYILIIETLDSKDKEDQLISFLRQKVPEKEIRILSLLSDNDPRDKPFHQLKCAENITQISTIKEIELFFLNAYFIMGVQTPVIEEFSSYMAGKFGLQIFNRCYDFIYDNAEAKLNVYKNICGGRVEAEAPLSLSGRPVCITLSNIVGDGHPFNPAGISRFFANYNLLHNRKIKLISESKPDLRRLALNDAKIVIAGGRGIQDKRDFELLQELADCLNGAVGASRAAVDEGKALGEQQVGQSGKTIRPDFYFAIGISGSPQHIFGMRNSKTIIALNIDPHAPIFKYADYGIIGDYKKIIPKLLEKIKHSNNL